MLQLVGLRRVGYYLATEQHQQHSILGFPVLHILTGTCYSLLFHQSLAEVWGNLWFGINLHFSVVVQCCWASFRIPVGILHFSCKKHLFGEFPGCLGVRVPSFTVRARVQSLVRELRSHKPHSASNNKNNIIKISIQVLCPFFNQIVSRVFYIEPYKFVSSFLTPEEYL